MSLVHSRLSFFLHGLLIQGPALLLGLSHVWHHSHLSHNQASLHFSWRYCVKVASKDPKRPLEENQMPNPTVFPPSDVRGSVNAECKMRFSQLDSACAYVCASDLHNWPSPACTVHVRNYINLLPTTAYPGGRPAWILMGVDMPLFFCVFNHFFGATKEKISWGDQ